MALMFNEDGTYSMVYPEGSTPIWLLPADRPKADPTLSPPKSVLLDTLGYVDAECNDTTAAYVGEDGKRIQVTFWMHHPPLVSYFTVHSPGVKPDAFPEMANVLATDGDIALLRIPSGPVNPLSDPPPDRYFIYRIGGGAGGEKQPWLRQLPNPHKLIFLDDTVGFLNYGTHDHDRFFAAAFYKEHPLRPGGSVKFYISLFDSETWGWIRKEVFVDSPEAYRYRFTNKVITIGGERGSIAWVDLSNGILIHDVLLRNNNILRYIPLPSSELPDLRTNSVRDMAFVDGCLKYVSMTYPPMTKSTTSYYFGDWKAKAWKMVTHRSENWQWQEDYHLRASEIAIHDPSHLELLPDLPNNVDKKRVLTKLHAGSPAVSLHDDGIVYIMTKVEFSHRKAWVLAVNTCTKALQAVAELDAERCTGFSFTYTQSEISKHMDGELKEDQCQDDEASWTTVSYKKERNTKKRRWKQ